MSGHEERGVKIGAPGMSCVHVDIRFIRPTARYGEKRVNFIRSHVRTQNSWLLHLAGDFHGSYENKQVLHSPHLMRCMLSSNLAVDQRFANGTQGRLLHWGPDVESSRKAAVPASHPDLGARFVKDKQPCKDLPSPHALESCTFRNIRQHAPPLPPAVCWRSLPYGNAEPCCQTSI